MIPFAPELFEVGMGLAQRFGTEYLRKKQYDEEKERSRKIEEQTLMQELSEYQEDLSGRYLAAGLDPSSLAAKNATIRQKIRRNVAGRYGETNTPR